MEDTDMEYAAIQQFRNWVKADIWIGPGESFYQALKKVMDQVGVGVDVDDFADGIWVLVEELQPSADRDRVAAIIDVCLERIQVLNEFFDANDIYGFDSP